MVATGKKFITLDHRTGIKAIHAKESRGQLNSEIDGLDRPYAFRDSKK